MCRARRRNDTKHTRTACYVLVVYFKLTRELVANARYKRLRLAPASRAARSTCNSYSTLSLRLCRFLQGKQTQFRRNTSSLSVLVTPVMKSAFSNILIRQQVGDEACRPAINRPAGVRVDRPVDQRSNIGVLQGLAAAVQCIQAVRTIEFVRGGCAAANPVAGNTTSISFFFFVNNAR